jgi:hypothetical protein
MYRFRVLEGKHTELLPITEEQKGTDSSALVRPSRVYKKGEVVESEKELDKMFMNKFERLGSNEPQEVSAGHPNTREIGPDPDFNDDIMDTQAQELKTRRGIDPESPRAKRNLGRAVAMEEDAEEEADDEPVESDLGDDVTSDFADAKKAEMKVFKDGKQYFVADSADPSKSLEKKGMTKAEMKAYLKEQVSDE